MWVFRIVRAAARQDARQSPRRQAAGRAAPAELLRSSLEVPWRREPPWKGEGEDPARSWQDTSEDVATPTYDDPTGQVSGLVDRGSEEAGRMRLPDIDQLSADTVNDATVDELRPARLGVEPQDDPSGLDGSRSPSPPSEPDEDALFAAYMDR